MGIGPYTTGRSGNDSSWMGSRHAVANAHPGTLKASAFTNAEGVTDGIVPSGYPLGEDEDGFLVPYDPTPDTGNTLVGFNIDNRDVSNGDETTAVLWHGRIRVDRLPVALTPPTGSAFTFTDVPADEGSEG